MSQDGYLQTKIREMNEKVLSLENEIKTLKTTIINSKKQFDQATLLMQNAIDIVSFKNKILNSIEPEVKHAIKKQYQLINNKQTTLFKSLTEESLKHIRKIMDKEIDELYSFNASITRVLTEKRILLPDDITKLKQYSDEIIDKGLEEVGKELLAKINGMGGFNEK